MAQISVNQIESETDWESFLASHPEANFLQSWYWGQFHLQYGHQIERVGFYDGDQLVGVTLSIVEPARRGRYLTVPAGPIIDWHDNAVVEAFAQTIKLQAKQHQCVFVRVRPQLESTDFSKQLFRQLGFIPAPTHFHAELTSQLDITKSADDLLMQMRKATRYEIRQGLAAGIKVSSSTDPADIQQFYDLEIATSKRQGFVPFSYQFLLDQFQAFAAAGQVLLYSAKLDDQLLAQAFVIFYHQEAAYHYGASTEAGRKHPGAYLIQWEAIQEAQRRGMSRYNFWGVAPVDQPKHRFAGVSIFKRGFGGFDFEYLHAQDLIINRPRYLLNSAVENVRQKVRRL